MNNEQVETIVPSFEWDILKGRGRGVYNHPGYRRFLRIVAPRKEEYQSTPDAEKRNFARMVLWEVLTRDTPHGVRPRFLKRQDPQDRNPPWVEMGEEEAVKKVARTLRELRPIVGGSDSERSDDDSAEGSSNGSADGSANGSRAGSTDESGGGSGPGGSEAGPDFPDDVSDLGPFILDDQLFDDLDFTMTTIAEVFWTESY